MKTLCEDGLLLLRSEEIPFSRLAKVSAVLATLGQIELVRSKGYAKVLRASVK